jgi:hypothetical protein
MVMEQAILDVKALMEDGPDWVQERAGIVLDMYEQHNAGELSDEEYAELLEDLARADQLDELSDDFDMKNKFTVSVMALKNVIGIVA